MSLMGTVKNVLGRIIYDPDDPARRRFERAREVIHEKVEELRGKSQELSNQAGEVRRRNDSFSQLVQGIRSGQDERD